jgi:two-component system response regulator AtoC
VRDAARRLGRRIDSIDVDAQHRLRAYSFPGNVRELRNVIERAVILETGPSLGASSVLLSPAIDVTDRAPFLSIVLGDDGQPPALRDVERAFVERVLRHVQGNKSQAARILGVSFPTIAKKTRDYGLD